MEIKFDEEVALSRLKQGDTQVFEAIYQHYWERLFNHAYSHLHDENDVKELIQDLFTELWQKRHSLDIHTSLNAYLQAALRFKILNLIKARFVREKHATSVKRNKFVSHTHIEEEIHYWELQAALNDALRLLPKQPRHVYELRQNQGLTYAEIADSLHISISTVEKHMIKAVKYIRKQLKGFNC